MRVGLHVGQLAQPVPGGIGRYIWALLDALPAAGCDVLPFAAGRISDPPAGLVDLGWPRGPWRYQAWHRLRRPRVRLAVDLVHAPSLAVPPATPLVVTIHDLAFRNVPDASTPRGRKFHEQGLGLARRHADAIVVPSHFTAGQLVDAGFDEGRISVAPHGSTPVGSRNDADLDTVLASLGLERPFVLSVGTVEPRKGFDVAAAAVRALPGNASPTLVIAGPPGWGVVEGLRGPKVRLLGAVGDGILDALYRTAVACVIPSRDEGFGFPVLEAMARGCPVIAADAGALPEILGDAGLLVPPDDVDALAAALRSVADDPRYCDELATRGRSRAASFTWQKSATAHRAAYDTAIRSHR